MGKSRISARRSQEQTKHTTKLKCDGKHIGQVPGTLPLSSQEYTVTDL